MMRNNVIAKISTKILSVADCDFESRELSQAHNSKAILQRFLSSIL